MLYVDLSSAASNKLATITGRSAASYYEISNIINKKH